ncbi:cytochrome P450 [Pseudonocardia sp. TRM90224]|uniref:cytochrome P450 n=1 Tax=Pseudonocardia sp. TRM90224 TaxID=2812678 RepID=UPI001E3B098E|nr:cytochrome P450 [Pseudonocardia sp. TRM90224]
MSTTVDPTHLPTFPLGRRRFDPPAEFAGLPPISPIRLPSGAAGWAVTALAPARALLADPRLSADRTKAELPVAELNERFQGPVPPGMFLLMDDPDHAHYRKMLTGQFTVRRMQALEARVEEIVTERLDALAAAGSPGDLVAEFALPVPSLVICELLGVPYERRAEFQHTTKTLLSVDATPEQLTEARQQVGEFMADLVAGKRARPDDAVISGLIAGYDLTDAELINISMLLLIAGHETTANMLSLGTFTLLQNPEQMRLLREQPELMPTAVEELLRYLSIVASFGLPRTATSDIEIDGVRIGAGQTVLISLPAVNRDPHLAEDPDTLDITRPRTSHVAFGHGIHQCLGQQLARTEMKIGYRQLLDRFPTLALACDPQDVPLRTDMTIYGAHALPVRW